MNYKEVIFKYVACVFVCMCVFTHVCMCVYMWQPEVDIGYPFYHSTPSYLKQKHSINLELAISAGLVG